jgi:beta-glucosidase
LPDPVEDRKKIADAVAVAKQADAVVMVLGGNPLIAHEGVDADSIELPGLQDELADAILAVGKPTVTVLLNGKAYAIRLLAQKAPAILEGWYLGQEGGTAVANVLFGDVNPSGKLPVSICRNVGQVPCNYSYQKPMDRGRYVFSEVGPIYRFGHGLSYTTFKYGQPVVTPATIPPTGKAVATVDVTNSGTREGDEVVQMYIHDVVASVTRPLKELRGFERIHLRPGETKTVRFEITPEKLQFYNREMKRVVEPGAFEIFLGGDSEGTVFAKLEVK